MFTHTKRNKMEEIMENNRQIQAKILTGVAVIFFGVMFLLSKSQVKIPHWILSWQSIVIVAGLVTLYRHEFKHFFGYILVFMGGLFMINEFVPNAINGNLFWPILIILIGVMIIAKATHFFGLSKSTESIPDVMFVSSAEEASDDYFKSTLIFGGNERKVISKNFKGANITCFFGGAEINLMQADIQQPIEIHVTAGFGGVSLIVPSHWTVKSDVTSIFGGVENKSQQHETVDPNKVVILKGTLFMGGIEVKSYS